MSVNPELNPPADIPGLPELPFAVGDFVTYKPSKSVLEGVEVTGITATAEGVRVDIRDSYGLRGWCRLDQIVHPVTPKDELPDDETSEHACPTCQTGELVWIGRLGFLNHYRCRHCGADTNDRELRQAELIAEDARIDAHYARIAHYDGLEGRV